jgi:hypothetical protein
MRYLRVAKGYERVDHIKEKYIKKQEEYHLLGYDAV